ncbi:MAG: Gfo/Idh/MocA family oxidoreductase [Fimbriimonadales bacterium]
MLKIALIGAGGIGRHLAKHAHRSKAIQLVAVYDPDYDSAGSLAQELDIPYYSSLPDMLERDQIEAVIIATPPYTHAELCLTALEYGKHVFCEKPMALRLEDCDAMIERASQTQRVLMVGQVLRFFPLFWQSKQWLDQGLIGEPVALSVRRMENSARLFSMGWRADPEKSGGALIEINVHELDYLRWVGGNYRVVSAQGRQPLEQPPFLQYWHAQLAFESGAVGQIEASIIDPVGDHTVRIVGTEGVITFVGFGDYIQLRTHQGDEHILTVEQLQLPNPYERELDCFARAVLYGEPLPFDGHDGREAVAKALECLAHCHTD